MAIKQVIQIIVTLQGDGVATVFTYAIEQMYLNQTGSATVYAPFGVSPSSAVINNPPVPVTSTTVDVNGNITITLTSPLGNGVNATFEVDLLYNSAAAVSNSPTQAQNSSLFAGTTALTATGSSLNANITNTVTVSGTIAVTQSTSPWVVNTTQWASTALGVPQTFGTAPTGVVIGTSSDLYVAGTRARSNQTTTAAGVLDVNNVGIDGVTIVTAAAGVQKVGIVGNTGAALDTPSTQNQATPANMLAVGGEFNTTPTTITSGNSSPVQLDLVGNLLNFPGVEFQTGAAWSSATALNTVQYQNGTTTIGSLTGAGAVVVQLVQTTTLTAGAVTFEATYDNIHWVTIPTTQILNPQTFATLTNPYTFVASTNQPFLIPLNGIAAIRIRLSTVITGTGTVTPYWTTLSQVPLQAIQVNANSGTLQVAVVPSSNTFFRFGQITTGSSGSPHPVESTTYTEQSTGAQRSISSSSANDTSAGTGARTVQITWYDASGNGANTENVTLNGTTAVATVATTICFIESIRVLTVGSTGSNVGTITLFVNAAGGGGTIGTIAATNNQTFWAHHYVPVGKTFHLTGINMGSNSSVAGDGAVFQMYAQTLPIANQPNESVSDFVTLYGQASNVTRSYNSPIQVSGPARCTLYVSPFAATSVTFYGSFDYFEQ